MRKAARLLVMLAGVFIAAICGFLLIVPFFGFGWHAFHADYISYAGWKIPVPKSYYVRQGENGPAIWKLSFGAPFFDAPFSHVSFFSTKPFAGTSDTERFFQAVSETATEGGYQFKAKRMVSIGTKTASCFEFTRSGKQPRSLMRCATENDNIFPFFEGDARYIPELFSTLSECHKNHPQKMGT
jgi:hypothetical protein